ncbi:D-sedoheptulose 7-phosphate isomerase [Candidatus Woesearchaeota archaeon]|nr:D-sedoheptulose 7-phosphate isomerase [Candidatus Woesearchaeota archaeon]
MVEGSISAKESVLKNNTGDIEEASKLIERSLNEGNKIMIAGNGGSAADSQHFAAEFVGRYKVERRGLPCIALTTDTSIITAWTNDYGFETLFARQIEALGRKGDVFIGISTSGNSPNIIKAMEKAKELGMKTVSLLGKDGGKLKEMADVNIIIKNNDTPRIQECHITVLHIIAELLDKND